MPQPGESLDQIPVLLLAGGKSSRMGSPKGLLPVTGSSKTWLEFQLECLAAVGIRNVILVLGFSAELYESRGLAASVCVNPQPEFGPFSSIQCGLRKVGEASQVFILPIDVPCPGRESWERLSHAKGEAVIPVLNGRGGHPVRISSAVVKGLLEIDPQTPDARLDVQLSLLEKGAVTRVEVSDPSVLKNLNSPEDWAQFWN